MCGRYTLAVQLDEVTERFLCPKANQQMKARYNVAPTQIMPVVLERNGQRQLEMMQWGLVPFWAKDRSMGSKLINARLETLEEKASFKYAVRERRCLIPADGYYEWQKTKDGKQAVRIIMPTKQLFAFAGLWEQWSNPNGEILHSYTIVTTIPVPSLAHIHDRMPLILKRDQEDYWLHGFNGKSVAEARLFLKQLKSVNDVIAYPVSNRVNSPKNDDPQCIEPID